MAAWAICGVYRRLDRPVCLLSSCDCTTRIDVPGDVYDKVRATPDRFLVANGHEQRDRRVAGTTAYSVVVVRAAGTALAVDGLARALVP